MLLFAAVSFGTTGIGFAQTLKIIPYVAVLNYPRKLNLALEFYVRARDFGDKRATTVRWELHGLPAGLVVPTLSPDSDCRLDVLAQPPLAGNARIHATRPLPRVLEPGTPGARCNPIVTDGVNPLEFYFPEEDEGGGGMAAADFPGSITLELRDPTYVSEYLETISFIYRYRIGDGAGVNDENDPEVVLVNYVFIDGCLLTQGDVDGSGLVTPNDAQIVFEHFLGIFQCGLCLWRM